MNGFYDGMDIKKPPWNNTLLDPVNNTTVHMFDLRVEHGGTYRCHIQPKPETEKMASQTVYLEVTGKREILFRP